MVSLQLWFSAADAERTESYLHFFKHIVMVTTRFAAASNVFATAYSYPFTKMENPGFVSASLGVRSQGYKNNLYLSKVVMPVCGVRSLAGPPVREQVFW